MTTCAAFAGAGCIFEHEISGAMPEIDYFVCADESPESPPMLAIPGTYFDSICADQSTWAALDIESQITLSFFFHNGDDPVFPEVTAHIIDPTGYSVATISKGDPELVLTLTPGQWLIAVEGEMLGDRNAFELSIDVVGDEE